MTSQSTDTFVFSEEHSLHSNALPTCVFQTTLSNCTSLEEREDCSVGSVCSYDTVETTCLTGRTYKTWSEYDLYLLQVSSKQCKPSDAAIAKSALGRSNMAIEKKRNRASKLMVTNVHVSKQQFCKKCKKPRLRGGHVCDPYL